MKSTVKHTRRSLMSILLALCMLASCITVGLVPTDAAKIDVEEKAGYDTVGIHTNASIGGGGKPI